MKQKFIQRKHAAPAGLFTPLLLVAAMLAAALVGVGPASANVADTDEPEESVSDEESSERSSHRAPARPTLPPFSEPSAPSPSDPPTSLIVVLTDEAERSDKEIANVAYQIAQAHGGQISEVYTEAFQGFAGTFYASANTIQSHPEVEFAEVEGLMAPSDGQQPTPSWGIDRIDQESLPLNNSYTYVSEGAGINAYVVDSGIRPSHNEFAGRVGTMMNFAPTGNVEDCLGHGTHVAGTLGGTSFGVAKGVTLHSMKISDNCVNGGTTTTVMVNALEWIALNHVDPAVVNISYGTEGVPSPSVDIAVQGLTALGVPVVTSAGNDAADACSSSPSGESTALTVANSTISDSHRMSSNVGPCVDLYAPGTGIRSAGIGHDADSWLASGTSMSSPHVAGAVARYLEEQPAATASAIHNFIVSSATAGKLTGVPSGTPNLLLYVTADDDILCGGLMATRIGTPGPDTLYGTSGPDVIVGLGGNDTIKGFNGDDRLCGGDGNDTINGNHGDDYIEGGDGVDTIDGGWHDDTIDGGLKGDVINGHDGKDTIDGGDGADTIDGGWDKDTINGGPGLDVISGGPNDDVINGGDDHDELFGNDGEDTINGGGGPDYIEGGWKDDTIDGGGGWDTCFGGPGSDTITSCP